MEVMTQVHVGPVVPIPLAVVRRRVRRAELGKAVQQGCGIVWDFVRAQQLTAGRNVAVYLSDAIDLEVGVELPGEFLAQGEIVRSSTPSGHAASATHFGPYQELGVAHRAIHDWCRDNGYKLTGPNWEIYGHWQAEWNTDASKIRTDVFYQVAR
jgi:effector-binding domain-containing protein